MRGGDREWRIRVGDYRVVYTIDDSDFIVEVTRIRHRKEVYSQWVKRYSSGFFHLSPGNLAKSRSEL
jgi:hypothetical protein